MAGKRLGELTFAGAGVTLAGTLSLPRTAGEAPGLVLVGGSGPSDRRNGGFFDTLAAHLAGAGVAVLRYDKRGVGASEGDWASATVEELAGDAAGACAALAAQPGVDADRVGVLGHSEGGWVALRLCTGPQAPAHLILNSCPAVSFLASEVHALRAAGAPPERAEAAGALLEQLSAAARAGRSVAEGAASFDALRAEPWLESAETDGFELDESSWSQLAVWGAHDPAGDLERLRVPAVAVLGAEDPLVPVAESARAYEQSAVERVYVFEGADHRLGTGEGLAAGYLETLSDRCLQLSARPR